MYDHIFKKYLNLKNNNKLGVKNAKFRLTDQDANALGGTLVKKNKVENI
jgi:hypothetical protein